MLREGEERGEEELGEGYERAWMFESVKRYQLSSVNGRTAGGFISAVEAISESGSRRAGASGTHLTIASKAKTCIGIDQIRVKHTRKIQTHV